MKIRKKPYDIDFLGNNPEFILRATPNSADGRRYSRMFTVNALPAGNLVLTIDEQELTWLLSANPKDSLWELPAVATTDAQSLYEALEGKFTYNPEITKGYTATLRIESGAVKLKITAKEPGNHVINLRHDGSPLFITQHTPVTGLDRVPKEDYRAMAFFEIQSADRTECTPAMYYEESNDDVHVATDIVKPWFGKPDVPNPEEYFSATPCRHAAVKVRLFFGEMYAQGKESTSLKTMANGTAVTLVNGEMEDYAAENNIPDWKGLDDNHLHLKTGFDIFGQDNADTVLCPCGSEQYIYIYNYEDSDIAARVMETVVLADGTTDDDWNDENITLKPGVNRITVREGDPRVTAWSVSVSADGHGTVSRNYISKAFKQGYHTFMMLNAMNLYETFIAEEIATEEQTQGERRIVAGRDSYGNTDRETVFTAKCHPRNAKGLKLLRTAFGKQDNLLNAGRFAWYVDMLPGSLTTSDESADVLEAEFKFRLREKIDRNPQIFNVDQEIQRDVKLEKRDSEFK